MTYERVQALCYYAQAWSLAERGVPIFSDEIQAWGRGPVIRVLYDACMGYGWREIPRRRCNEKVFSAEELGILREVYQAYGGLTGGQLRTLICAEAPWRQQWGRISLAEGSAVPIGHGILRDYYRRQLRSFRAG